MLAGNSMQPLLDHASDPSTDFRKDDDRSAIAIMDVLSHFPALVRVCGWLHTESLIPRHTHHAETAVSADEHVIAVDEDDDNAFASLNQQRKCACSVDRVFKFLVRIGAALSTSIAILDSVYFHQHVLKWNQFFYYAASACIIMFFCGGAVISHTFVSRWVRSGAVHSIMSTAFTTQAELRTASRRVRFLSWLLAICVCANILAYAAGMVSDVVQGKHMRPFDLTLVAFEYTLTELLQIITACMLYVVCVITIAVRITLRRFREAVSKDVYKDCSTLQRDYMAMFDRLQACITGQSTVYAAIQSTLPHPALLTCSCSEI